MTDETIADETKSLIIKARYFFTNSLPVHLTFKKSATWLNGYIIEPFNEEYFFLEEFVKGKIPNPIVFLDVKDIVGYTEKEDVAE